MTWIGMVCWLVILWPVWSPSCRRVRKRMRVSRNPRLGSTPQPVATGIHASPTTQADDLEADMETWGVGPEWEQDKPFPELFEDGES